MPIFNLDGSVVLEALETIYTGTVQWLHGHYYEASQPVATAVSIAFGSAWILCKL